MTGPAPAACIRCGAGSGLIGADRYCVRCGVRQPASRDHVEVGGGPFAGVSDRGKRHHRNEDAMGVAQTSTALVAVVCDGVSSTTAPDDASQAAADASLLCLVTHLESGHPVDFVTAACAAQAAVLAVPFTPEPGKGDPSCTLVMAVVDAGAGRVDVGWIGDSRVYWIPRNGGARCLTVDDSWAAEAVEAGILPQVDAEADPRAHTITRWLGADAPTIDPHTFRCDVTGPGLVLVCSDGLWNYASGSSAMGRLLARLAPRESTPTLAVASALVASANDAGGDDNITVVVLAVPGPPALTR